MAKSCYDPEAAIGLYVLSKPDSNMLQILVMDLRFVIVYSWHRMALAEKHSPPQFLSTHPSVRISYNLTIKT